MNDLTSVSMLIALANLAKQQRHRTMTVEEIQNEDNVRGEKLDLEQEAWKAAKITAAKHEQLRYQLREIQGKKNR